MNPLKSTSVTVNRSAGNQPLTVAPTIEPVRFGVIGYGYWGPQLVRNLSSLGGGVVECVADLDDAQLARARAPK